MTKPDVKSDKMSKFNFIWVDSTNFLPYTEETLNENSIFARQGACLGNAQQMALNSLARYGNVNATFICFLLPPFREKCYIAYANTVHTYLFHFNPENFEKV